MGKMEKAAPAVTDENVQRGSMRLRWRLSRSRWLTGGAVWC